VAHAPRPKNDKWKRIFVNDKILMADDKHQMNTEKKNILDQKLQQKITHNYSQTTNNIKHTDKKKY